jgi:hypothetical protein
MWVMLDDTNLGFGAAGRPKVTVGSVTDRLVTSTLNLYRQQEFRAGSENVRVAAIRKNQCCCVSL